MIGAGLFYVIDPAMALAQGADFLGINCWSGSPRFVPAAARSTLLREIPADKRVAVTVNPTVAEATALIADTVCEAARDGARLMEAAALGASILTVDDVLPGVPDIVREVKVEAMFDDGTRLVVDNTASVTRGHVPA